MSTNVNVLKCHLIIKEESNIKALRLFEETTVKVIDSYCILGPVIGQEKAYKKHSCKVFQFVEEIEESIKNFPSKLFLMHLKSLAVKFNFNFSNNAQLTEHLKRP